MLAGVLLAPDAGVAAEPAKLVQTVCASCHTLDLVTKKRASRDEWHAVVDKMVKAGAPLTPDEAGAVAEYLAAKYSKTDRGKQLVETVCVLCHDFSRISTEALTRDQWAGEIRGMIDEGAPLTEDEFNLVLDYLTKTYGVNNK